MFTSIPSLDSIVQCLLPAFTQPSFQTHIEVLLGWVMCLGKRTEYGVFQATQADAPVSRTERHPFDRFYNFFSRSAWTVHDLAHEVAVAGSAGVQSPGHVLFADQVRVAGPVHHVGQPNLAPQIGDARTTVIGPSV